MQKKRKKNKHDSLLCSYLVLRFSVRLLEQFGKLVLGLFIWIGGARFFGSFILKKKKHVENDHQLS